MAPPSAPTVAAQPFPSEDSAAVPISPRNPTWGSRTALVTLVEFADFQCPYSARVQATLETLRTKYGPDKLRIVWKNDPLPFHANARGASLAAMGVFDLAGNDAFWKFHDALFGNQTHLGEDNYERWAVDAGVTALETFRAGLAPADGGVTEGRAGRWSDAVDADLRDAQSIGAQGTPSFYINGVHLQGAQPLDRFVAVLDQELLKAKAKLDAGTSAGTLYAELSRENRSHPPTGFPGQGNGDADDRSNEEEREREDTSIVYRIPVGPSPVRGKATAWVTLVEFGDFQCPFCSRVQPTLSALRTRYGDKLRIVWKNEPLPFHPVAEPAAEAALEVRAEVGDAAFWTVHDAIFAAQLSPIQGQPKADVDGVVKMAVAAGANAAKVRAAIEHKAHADEIEMDKGLADDFEANGTPHFFINGRRLVGAQPEERFTKIIDEEIDKAKGLVAKGVLPADLYTTLTAQGRLPRSLETKDLPSPLSANDPARGNPNAKVAIHEWADFQCPFSQRVQSTLAEVTKTYGARVKFVWHDLPLPMHPDAPLASEAAREAYKQKGPAGFWAMHDALFKNRDHLKRPDLDGYARQMNLNMTAWAAALDSEAHLGEVEADQKAGTAALITGTPAFLVVPSGAQRGYFVAGAQPLLKFRRVIDWALAEAK